MQSGRPSVNERTPSSAAALKGAALAFAASKPKPVVGPKPKPALRGDIGRGDEGGIVTGLNRTGEDTRLRRDDTEGSLAGRNGNGNGNGLLQPPGLHMTADGTAGRSASLIAATLAASRSASVSPNPTGSSGVGTGMGMRMGMERRAYARSPSVRSVGSESSDVVDSMSIPPTRGLIGMFETNGNAGQGKVGRAGNARTGRVPPRTTSMTSLRARARSPSPVGLRVEVKRGPKPPTLSPKPDLGGVRTGYFPVRPKTSSGTPEKAKPPPPVSKHIKIPAKPKPAPPTLDADSSDDSFVSASSQHTEHKPSFRAAIAEQKRNRLTSNSSTSLPSTTATIDSMANAIVASSLASSRAASPSKHLVQPPLPPARRSHRIFPTARTPSPVKQQHTSMKTTLRKVKSKDSIDEREKRTGKKSLVKKHPHKHHEGDRKRWRDAITERERKRYEAVWASNRGLWLGREGEDGVCSLVARDVWTRSRLNLYVLEEVYALVDRSQSGSLEREEFVVGLWLVDQYLRGRKLPVRVGESVWRSVGGTGGIKIHGPKK